MSPRVDEIKKAIRLLSREDRLRLAEWLLDQMDGWGKQIAADFRSGKLDDLLREADAEIAAGSLGELP
jgi:hypothetical protein